MDAAPLSSTARFQPSILARGGDRDCFPASAGGFPSRSSIPGGASCPAPPSPGLPRQRALDGRGLPFLLEGPAHGKTGLVHYRVSGLETGGDWLVYPEGYLTPTQVERMAHQPDLILVTAHIIREDFISRGHEDVEVRADAYVAYNGRPAARLVDPEVDLAGVTPGLGHKTWVLSAPEGRAQDTRSGPARGMAGTPSE